jgi:uncharacterized protein
MLTPLSIQKIELSIAYTAVYIASEDRLFVIYLPSQSGKLLQQLIAKAPCERPSSFDVILSLITGSNLVPFQVVIEDEKDGVFFTKIYLEKHGDENTEILEIAARPSESLAIAIKYQVPLLIHTSLLQRLSNLLEAAQD